MDDLYHVGGHHASQAPGRRIKRRDREDHEDRYEVIGRLDPHLGIIQAPDREGNSDPLHQINDRLKDRE